jgi:replicative DNA helicase
MKTDHLILKNLIHNEDYCRSVIPFLKDTYFSDLNDRRVFTHIQKFVGEYNQRPAIEALKILNENASKTSNEDKVATDQLLDTWTTPENHKLEWLIKETETFCKDQAIVNALGESIEILNNPKDKRDKGIIPDLLRDALSIAFDNRVGHDFINSAAERYDFYHKKDERIPFDIEILNTITNGGLSKKTLTILIAGVHAGKSLAMCHMATANLLAGKKVLYITCEMSEEKVAERIDANILDISIDSIKDISKKQFLTLMAQVYERTPGKLIIKEYPTSTANVNHFRFLLHELQVKNNFVPDIIYVDYMNICTSATLKNNGTSNSYTIVKAISEELRGLAVEYNLPIVTATQFTRSGSANTDADMTDVAESFGVMATADLVMAIINTPELQQMRQLMFKQLKNRLGDVTKNVKSLIGVDRMKMRLYDIGNTTVDEFESVGSPFDAPGPSEEKTSKFGSFKF